MRRPSFQAFVARNICAILELMKLGAQVKLLPDARQAAALRRTLELVNEACNYVSEQAWTTHTWHAYSLHRLLYYEVKERYDLTAQIVVRLLAKVADAYKLNRNNKRTFKSTGAIGYDDRILRWYTDRSAVSIWTVEGRLHIPFVCGERQRELLRSRQGESNLMLFRDAFVLSASCDVEEPELLDVQDVIGIDLGIVNLATDSDGETFSGVAVERKRRIYAHRRRNLQRKGTKAARRKLRQLAGRQACYQKDINHQISKRIVHKAHDTQRAIAVENLTGIRSRTTVRRKQRARHANWSFFQLKSFVVYKAQRAGVPVYEVDPRNTSRECPACGCIDKANRPNQITFSCVSCGYAANADHNAARNIRARAAVNLPSVSTTPAPPA
jgi:putative transposase